MALVLGTNCGFVTATPSADPNASATIVDDTSKGTKDTSPATAAKITEIGWWCGNASSNVNYEVGLYSHNSETDKPDTLIEVSRTNAKGTDAGWKSVAVNWNIDANTIYWMTVQVDDNENTFIDYTSAAGEKANRITVGQTTLVTDGAGYTILDGWIHSVYVVWEAEEPVGTNMQINISDVWKDIESLKINIGNVWKDVVQIQQNIGDVWKNVFG